MNSPNFPAAGKPFPKAQMRCRHANSHAYTPVASRHRQLRHTIRICLTLLITLVVTTDQARAVVCLTGPPTAPDERGPQAVADQLNVLGNDPLVPNKKRVRTHQYTDADGTVGRVRGGDYSAAAVDRLLYNGEKGQNSSTVNAGTVNTLVSSLNHAAGSTTLFVAGHLVNHEFGGNKTDRGNFTALTSKANSAMKNFGEKTAKTVMDRIDSNYPSEQFSWVATQGTKKYKVGVFYETQIVDPRSVSQYEAQPGNGALISNPSISTTLKSRMPATLETNMKLIIHEYEPKGKYMKANGKWFDMPQTLFDAPFDSNKPTGPTIGEKLMGGLLPGQIDPQTGSSIFQPPNNDAVTVNVSDYGREVKWVYWNRDN